MAVLVVNGIMYWWWPTPFEALYRTKFNQVRRLAARGDRPLILMLGSSRTDFALQAVRLDGVSGPDGRPLLAYNFGIPTAGPLHECQYVRDMLDAGIRPRLLLVEVLPLLFNRPHGHLISEEDWPVPDWMTWHQFVRMHSYFARPGRKASEWVAARLAPWYTHRFSLHAWLTLVSAPLQKKGDLVPFSHDGWGSRCPTALTGEERTICQLAARDYVPSLSHFRLGQGPVRAMGDLLGFCRQEDISVALVLMPETSAFRSWYPPECLETIHTLLERWRVAYGVEVLDATRWLDDEDFLDGHHLDTSGARKFTDRMRDEVRGLLR
jgi:hypothetical protein